MKHYVNKICPKEVSMLSQHCLCLSFPLGFAAVVNKAMSSKFAQLVDSTQDFLPLLPWGGAEFEKDKFLRPDLTSLHLMLCHHSLQWNTSWDQYT